MKSILSLALVLLIGVFSSGCSSSSRLRDSGTAPPVESRSSLESLQSPKPTKSELSPQEMKEIIEKSRPTIKPEDNVTAEVKEIVGSELENLIISADKNSSGMLTVNTYLTGPKIGDPMGTDQSLKALQICESVRALGYHNIRIMEKNRTHFVLFGHPMAKKGECTEV